jgi:hypothetical protein
MLKRRDTLVSRLKQATETMLLRGTGERDESGDIIASSFLDTSVFLKTVLECTTAVLGRLDPSPGDVPLQRGISRLQPEGWVRSILLHSAVSIRDMRAEKDESSDPFREGACKGRGNWDWP